MLQGGAVGSFGGPSRPVKGVHLEVPRGCSLRFFREPQGGCSWRLLVDLKSGLRKSFQVYYGLML